MIKIYTVSLYYVNKNYLLLLLLLSSSDLLFSKFILHYWYHYHYYHRYHYHYYYQILILILYQYNSQCLCFLPHIYILLKMFGGDIFHMHKGQNLELLLINIYVVFFLLVLFQTLFYDKNLQLYCFHIFYFCFYIFFIIAISRFGVKFYTH